MNEPRVPDNNKDWKEIDIYIFPNGQQYSPPRKYHLQSDQLEFWEATINYLARTQYGSMHSNIELYTLDGKKVDSPLELIDAASYVAVEPPDAFINAGYERYLIKASRSWEKRQEKLNVPDTKDELKLLEDDAKPAVDELKIIETTNIQNPQSILEKDLDSIGTNNTIIERLRDDNYRSSDEKSKVYKPFMSRKSVDSVKIKNFKKVTPPISKTNSKESSVTNKKLNVPRNFRCSTSRRQSISTKSEKKYPQSNTINPKEQTESKITKIPEDMEVKERIVLSKPSSLNENQSHEASKLGFYKNRLLSSDVYKNPESEVQSAYIDADRKTTKDYPKDNLKSNELHKIVELNKELVNSLKANKAISKQSLGSKNKQGQEINTSFSSKAKVFNIKLNIEVKDDRDSVATEKSGLLSKCRSCTELFTLEQESQANIDINFNNDFKYEDNTPKASVFNDKAYLNSEVVDAKIIIVNCTCGLSEARNITDKIKENYILLVPSTFAGKNIESCRCEPYNKQTFDKDSLKSRYSILNAETNPKTDPISKDNSQTIIKHKVSICPDSPIKISADLPSDTDKDSNVVTNQPLVKVEQFTQTEWCNILLQARQTNGDTSLHLPPLHVLAKYKLL